MKKFLVVILTVVAACALFACTNNTEKEEETEVSPNAVVVPVVLGDVSYMTGAWEVSYSSDNQMVYATDFSVITFAYRESGVTPEDALNDMLVNTQFGATEVDLSGEIEEVEINDISGYKQYTTIGGMEAELFVFQIGDNRYYLLSVFTDPDNIAEARGALDSVFSSMKTTTMPEPNLEEDQPPAEEEADSAQ